VAALLLQVRDVVFAGVEENVKQALLDRMKQVMTPTVKQLIEARLPTAIEEGKPME
jgi:hypothetical protein